MALTRFNQVTGLISRKQFKAAQIDIVPTSTGDQSLVMNSFRSQNSTADPEGMSYMGGGVWGMHAARLVTADPEQPSMIGAQSGLVPSHWPTQQAHIESMILTLAQYQTGCSALTQTPTLRIVSGPRLEHDLQS